jgi:xanthine/uracil permease
MVPGGAPAMLFAVIATQTDLRTAAGAAILTSLFYWLVLPVFARCLRFFPRVVVGTMLLLVSVSLIKIYAGIVVGQAGTPGFARPQSLGLALLTIVATLAVARLFKGTAGRLAVLLGLAIGTGAGWAAGLMPAGGMWAGPLFTLPVLLPFGMPRFDVLAALPMLIFSVISMAEATGQTVAVGEITGKKIDMRRDVPRTIRGDAVASLLGSLLGTSLIITSAENIGVVQTTGVRSRYVTATAGAMLMVIALFAPLGRFAYAIPAPVVGGTALIVFAMIGVMGVNLLGKVDLHARGNQYTLAAALVVGLLPILVPNVYASFPGYSQIILGNGMAAGTLTAIVVNLVFGAWRVRPVEKVQAI